MGRRVIVRGEQGFVLAQVYDIDASILGGNISRDEDNIIVGV